MDILKHLTQEIKELEQKGLYKKERHINSMQSHKISVKKPNGEEKAYLNLCANNYLGLADNKNLIESSKKALDEFGFGAASVRFICGTQTIHKKLENTISNFLGTEDTILYSSCFDANGGLFETLLTEEDAIISDELNHASIIDGVRLSKAKRFRYKNNDMNDLKSKLEEAKDARFKMIATDGIFSMDGYFADLPSIVELAKQYGAMVMVDDSHATGFIGKGGRGTPEHFGVEKEIDVYTSTLGKAMGGAMGGYTSGKAEIIEWLRQRSRPYLFSNSLAPMLVSSSITAFEFIQSDEGNKLRKQLKENQVYFREKMTELGFNLLEGEHPITPVMLGDAIKASELASKLDDLGVFVTAFSFPVVPKNKARIRVQMNASLTKQDLDKAIMAFEKAGKELNII